MRYFNCPLQYRLFSQTNNVTVTGTSPVTIIAVIVPVSTAYVFDLLYNFNDANGSITIGQSIIDVAY